LTLVFVVEDNQSIIWLSEFSKILQHKSGNVQRQNVVSPHKIAESESLDKLRN